MEMVAVPPPPPLLLLIKMVVLSPDVGRDRKEGGRTGNGEGKGSILWRELLALAFESERRKWGADVGQGRLPPQQLGGAPCVTPFMSEPL